MSYYVQIYYVQNSISLANQKIEEKRMDLKQLETALSNLNDIHQDFKQNQRLCTEPELNQHSWHGQLATDFETIRDGQILVSYQDLSTNQLANVKSQIANEIQNINQEIESLQGDIVSLQSRLSDLYAMQRRYEESLKG